MPPRLQTRLGVDIEASELFLFHFERVSLYVLRASVPIAIVEGFFMKYILLSLGVLLSLAMTAAAQNAQGRVVDLLGVGVSGVTVECVTTCFPTAAPQASATTSTTTDSNGNFAWPLPGPPGAGSGCMLSTQYAYTLKKAGYIFTRGAFLYRPSPPPAPLPAVDERISLIQATSLPAWANVSAASFANTQLIANDMIVAGFGANLATQTATAASGMAAHFS